MSQLNNINENKEEKPIIDIPYKKKMKASTKIVIFLILFAILCIAITTVAILISNKDISSDLISKPTTIENDGLGIKSLTEQYNENDLKIINISDKKGKRNTEYDWDTNIGKINIDYIKIDGLKNEKIENQINKDIMVLLYSFPKAERSILAVQTDTLCSNLYTMYSFAYCSVFSNLLYFPNPFSFINHAEYSRPTLLYVLKV